MLPAQNLYNKNYMKTDIHRQRERQTDTQHNTIQRTENNTTILKIKKIGFSTDPNLKLNT